MDSHWVEDGVVDDKLSTRSPNFLPFFFPSIVLNKKPPSFLPCYTLPANLKYFGVAMRVVTSRSHLRVSILAIKAVNVNFHPLGLSRWTATLDLRVVLTALNTRNVRNLLQYLAQSRSFTVVRVICP